MSSRESARDRITREQLRDTFGPTREERAALTEAREQRWREEAAERRAARKARRQIAAAAPIGPCRNADDQAVLAGYTTRDALEAHAATICARGWVRTGWIFAPSANPPTPPLTCVRSYAIMRVYPREGAAPQ